LSLFKQYFALIPQLALSANVIWLITGLIGVMFEVWLRESHVIQGL